MFGFSTYGIAMSLYKWLPLKLVDKFLLLVASFLLGNTNHYGIKRPKTGPIELKLATGKTPVLDVGQITQIKAGNIKVWFYFLVTQKKIKYKNQIAHIYGLIQW
jgi:indole-3-pyruvate monooxygenase